MTHAPQIGEAFEGEDWDEYTAEYSTSPAIDSGEPWTPETFPASTPDEIAIGSASDHAFECYVQLYPSERTPERLRAAYEHAAQAAALLRPWAGEDNASE